MGCRRLSVLRFRAMSDPGSPEPPILQEEINRLVHKGYRVVSQTERSAQLVKPKKFSFWWALIWFLVFGVGLVVYLIYYAGKKDQQVYLTIDAGGKLQRQ